MESVEARYLCEDIGIDQACIFLKSNQDDVFSFQYQSMECEECDLTNIVAFNQSGTPIILDYVSFGTVWRLVGKKNSNLCSVTKEFFREGSWYNLSYDGQNCLTSEYIKGPSVFSPIYIAVAVYVLLLMMWMLGSFMYKHRIWEKVLRSRNSLNVSMVNELSAAYSSSSVIEDRKQMHQKQRLRSLDTVRGLSVIIMIFVNYGGGKYWFFHHARWNGLTIADLVFPWFIWMMGMSMALSMQSLLRKEVPRWKIFTKILKRSVILFALGLMLNTYCLVVDLKDIRISGVLQRFSLSYFVVAVIHLWFAKTEEPSEASKFSDFRDIFPYLGEWLVMILILASHLLITFILPVPNCPRGYIGPGGLHMYGNYSLCTGGAAGYIDRVILGEKHLYNHPTFKPFYKNSLPYDPEGILGYLTSIFLVYLGLQAGKIILIYQTPRSRLIRWMVWAVATGILAIILSKGTKNEGWIPINKNLWSVSYILATGSMAFILISICYMIIDVKKWWTGAPFFCAGMNSILLYIGHTITHKMFPWSFEVPANHGAKLAIDLWGTTLWVIIAAWAHHVNFFVTV